MASVGVLEQRQLGSTGRRVSAIGFGARALAAAGRPSEFEALRAVHAALDLGISWIDVADAYSLGEADFGYCEQLVRRAIASWRGPRDTALVIAKGGYKWFGNHLRMDCRPKRLHAACDATLRALGTSSLFLYQLHGPDPRVYFPDSVGALADLQAAGKIQHVGLCNVDLGHLEEANKIVRVATVQNSLNVCDRQSLANGVLAWCVRNHSAFIAHSPMGGSWGHGRIASHPVLLELARKYAASPYEIALAWLLSLSPRILPIPGGSRLASVESSVRAARRQLAEEDLRYLQRTFAPANFLVRQLVHLRRRVRHVTRNARLRTRWPALGIAPHSSR